MKIQIHVSILAATIGTMALTGCAGMHPTQSAQSATAALPKFSHPRDINNPYLPLASLKQDILENKELRVERTMKPDVVKTFQVGGQTIEALTVEDLEYDAGGNLKEATLDYFAQDDDGNVY